jgi:hypothetical protein
VVLAIQERLAQYQQDVIHNESELKRLHQDKLQDAQQQVQRHADLLEKAEAAHRRKVRFCLQDVNCTFGSLAANW